MTTEGSGKAEDGYRARWRYSRTAVVGPFDVRVEVRQNRAIPILALVMAFRTGAKADVSVNKRTMGRLRGELRPR